MDRVTMHPYKKGLKGTLKMPGDKSITHRAIMLGAVANGKTTVKRYLNSADCNSTIRCVRQLGIHIEEQKDTLTIHGNGWTGLREAEDTLDVGNSGTTIRLLSGILAGSPIHTEITGDASIRRRPMGRVVQPLLKMGASITGKENGEFAPLTIAGGNTKGITYESPVASAQVKSAILFCGLQSEGMTKVTEPYRSRDHSERILKSFGAAVMIDERTVRTNGRQNLQATSIEVPGDISSAAFFLGAGAITPGSQIKMKDVGLNPTRTGIIDILIRMDANISITNKRLFNNEPVGDITIGYSSLQGIEIGGEMIPRLIDEIPMIALIATQASGVTYIKDAAELRMKETDRIETIASELQKLGIVIETTEDGMIIEGNQKVKGGSVSTNDDHRIGMMLAVASCIATDEVSIDGIPSLEVSYPGFLDDLDSLKSE
ncbi:3-phosphoshikimate 1-carboxyvinyltransferase [Alkalihalobacillus sp. AL-G]|uniref:3-phosphoshikimate 1-carboxyvinyltransferase n=1 Tax=Alkalihalobacillus sp. AL-G TaxID=2926399 RepID=UPI00272B0E02|nr:3-phosphoshikimate 1-carboxyvinyltransferase [Alkalihalobacillus sp. AL-G]WLD91818.1 3-phosphoshikimate 1-carboxyvinyltransferase [Alkalihalobacillus sp. AL-G]